MITVRLVRQEPAPSFTPGLLYPQAFVEYYSVVNDGRHPVARRSPGRSTQPRRPWETEDDARTGRALEQHRLAFESDRAMARARERQEAEEIARDRRERHRKDAEADRVIARLRRLR
jgi:hypothetical protein